MSGPYISVVTGGEVDHDLLDAADTIGARLAEADITVVCGGLGPVLDSLIDAVARGGGTSVSLLPGVARDDATSDATVSIPTGLGEARNAVVARAGDVMIAIGGGFGTLSEMAMAARRGIPIIGYRTWSLAAPHGDHGDPVIPADTATAAAAVAISLVRR